MRWLALPLSVFLLFAGSSWAVTFSAAELIYIPGVAHNEGVQGSVWRSDLHLLNVSDTPVDVAVFFMPSSYGDNSYYLDTRLWGLGGREEEGWRWVEPSLADIPPGGSVTIEDVVGKYWYEEFGALAGLGMLVVFAYEAGTADEPNYKNIVAWARTYNDTTVMLPDPESEDPENPDYYESEATYGQLMPGIPWYNLADCSAQSEQGDFTYLMLTGATEKDPFRFNLGIFNGSDKQTGITVKVTAIAPDGTVVSDEEGNPIERFLVLGPLANVQINRALWSWFELEEAEGYAFKIAFEGWNTTNPNPVALFGCYGSLVDGRANDPTTILPSFAYPYNIECMWPSESEGGEGEEEGDQGGTTKKAYSVPQRHKRPLNLPRW